MTATQSQRLIHPVAQIIWEAIEGHTVVCRDRSDIEVMLYWIGLVLDEKWWGA